MTDASWRRLFTIAALFNLVGGIPALVAPNVVLARLGMAPLPHDLFVRTSGLMIVLFGIGYWLVGRDFSRRELAWLGAVGKVGAFLLFLSAWRGGTLPFRGFALGIADLFFAGAFLAFLFSTRDRFTPRSRARACPFSSWTSTHATRRRGCTTPR